MKDTNYNTIIMSGEFESLEQTLMVEIIRRKTQHPLTRSPGDGYHEYAISESNIMQTKYNTLYVKTNTRQQTNLFPRTIKYFIYHVLLGTMCLILLLFKVCYK